MQRVAHHTQTCVSTDCGKLKKLRAVIGANTRAPWLIPDVSS